MEQVLNLAPNATGQPICTKAAFFIVSPPGFDVSPFSERFAKENNCEYLSPFTLMQRLVHADASAGSLRDEVTECLLNGREVPTETVLKVLDAAINSDEAKCFDAALDDIFSVLGSIA